MTGTVIDTIAGRFTDGLEEKIHTLVAFTVLRAQCPSGQIWIEGLGLPAGRVLISGRATFIAPMGSAPTPRWASGDRQRSSKGGWPERGTLVHDRPCREQRIEKHKTGAFVVTFDNVADQATTRRLLWCVRERQDGCRAGISALTLVLALAVVALAGAEPGVRCARAPEPAVPRRRRATIPAGCLSPQGEHRLLLPPSPRRNAPDADPCGSRRPRTAPHAYLVTWKFPRPESGNPITIEPRSDVIYVHVWKRHPDSRGVRRDTQQWTAFAEGFYRVVAER
jgi:hypothetical protein